MTISLSDNDPRISYTVSQGVTQTTFTVPFEFFDLDDLNVYVDGTQKTKTTHYTLASGGSGATGSITMSVTGATGGSTVVITRAIDHERTTDFQTSGPFNIASLNTELDRFTAIAADLQDGIDRSLRLTDFDTDVSLTLPDLNTRKGKTLAFNASSGAVEAGPSISDVQTVSATAADIAALADIEDGTIATDAISGLAAIKANVTTVAGIASNVTTVAGNTSNINAVAADASDIGTVASNISSVNTNASNISAIQGAAANAATASTKATEAAASAATASTQASNASTSAATSTTQATNSANSATAAASSATAAASSASSAASSQSAAASSATAAAASQTAAAASAASAATAFDNFDDTYLGSKTSNPAQDNDGNALVSGALYFNSSANEMRVYDGANWIAATSAGNVSLILYEYNATANQTTFSGSDTNSATLSYTVDNLQVVVNGIVLDPSDFTATNGTSVVLASGAAAGDVVNIYAFKSFTTADMVSKTAGGTFSGAVGFSGGITGDVPITGHASIGVNAVNSARALTVAGATDGSSSTILQLYNSSLSSKFSVRDDGFVDVAGTMTITTDDNTTQLTLKSTDADNNIGPQLDLRRDSGSPADSDVLGRVRWLTDDDAGNLVESAILQSNLEDASQGAVDTQLQITTSVASTMRNRMKITSSEVVFNEDSIDSDFRVEGNGNANALVVHGADDFVGIGLGTPKKRLHIQDTTSDGMIILDRADTSADHQICFAHNYGNSNQSGGNYYAIGVDDSENRLVFAFDANSQASLSADAKAVLNSDGGFLVGTTDASMTGLPDARLRSHANGKTGLIVSEVFQSEYGIVVQASSNTGNRFGMLFLNGGLGTAGSITFSSTAVAFNSSSDYRLKENVADMTGAIDRVKALAPKRFNFIVDADTTVDGFLAHEVQVVVPESVTGTKDETREITNAVLSSDGGLIAEDVTEAKWTAGKLATEEDGKTIPAIYPSDSIWSAKHTEPVMQGIDQAKLVPLLTGALQEAVAKIEALEARVAALEAGS